MPAFEKFMQGFAAAVHLLNTAKEKRSALECIVLQANLIDGLLRTGLILRRQLKNGSSLIDELLIKQEDGERMISERKIFELAFNEGVVTEAIFDELSAAYKSRNKAIHRYLLCRITYDDAVQLVYILDDLMDRIKDCVHQIEQDQIKLGTGMTVVGPSADPDFLREFAAKKEKRHNLG